MQLSEAIRLGSTMHGQAFGVLETDDHRTCAAGAALDAIGKLDRYWTTACSLDSVMEPEFPIWSLAQERPAGVAVGLDMRPTVGDLVIWMNDTLRWSRETIADWVQEVEERQDRVLEDALIEAGRQDKAEAPGEVLCA